MLILLHIAIVTFYSVFTKRPEKIIKIVLQKKCGLFVTIRYFKFQPSYFLLKDNS